MKIARNKLHYIIMTVIYNELNDFVFGDGKVYRDAREIIADICETPFEQCDPFIIKVVSTSLQNYGVIKDAFSPYLKNWKWERIPLLSQAILLMSYSHFYYVDKVDKSVVIDIAVTLAKNYIDEKQASFINAILDGVLN